MAFTRTGVDKKLVTGIAMMDTREINPSLMDVACDNGMDDLMMAVKRYKVTKQPDYHHFVNENALQKIVIDTGGVTGSGTATLTLTITTTGFVRRGDKFLLPNGKVGMINSTITTASNKDSFTMTSVDGSNLTAVAGNTMAPIGLVVGEKSDAVAVINYGQTKYFNQIETLRDKTEISDIQMKSTVEVGNGYYAYTQSEQQAIAFKLKLSATLVAGVKSTNTYGTASPTLVDENGNSTQTTGGFANEVIAYGVNDTVTTPGTVVNADTDDLLDQLNAVKAPTQYLVMSPDNAWRQYDNFFKNLGSAGVTSARLNMDGNEVNLNISKWTKGKRTLEFAPMSLLDHPEIFNFSGSSSIGKCVWGIPKDKVKTVGADGKGGNETRIGVRYFPNSFASKNQGTEYIREYYTGGMADTPTSGKQVKECHIITQQGMECIGTRQMFKQVVTA